MRGFSFISYKIVYVHEVNRCLHEVDVVIVSDWATTAVAALALALSPPFFLSLSYHCNIPQQHYNSLI